MLAIITTLIRTTKTTITTTIIEAEFDVRIVGAAMLFAQEFSGSQLIMFGVSILAGTLLLRRAAVRLQRSKARDVQAEVREEMRAAEQAGSATIRNLELRMYEFSREVEGRMQTRIATLDQLVVDADREIDRLRTLIAQTGQAEPSIRMKPGPEIIGPAMSGGGEEPQPAADCESAIPFTQPQRRMILHLAQAGFAADEISQLLDCRRQTVQAVLDSQLPPDQRRVA